MKKALRVITALGSLLVAAQSVSQAQSVGEFYKNKMINLITGDAAGGSYDTWSRLIARHMASHVPGNPRIIVRNMPGAGHITATNYLFEVAAKDGTVIGMVSRNMPHTALMRHQAVRFDPTKFTWIGSPEMTNRVCVAVEGAPVQKAEDLFEKELIVGGAGAGTAVSTTPAILRNVLGMKFRVVEGYKAVPEVFLAKRPA